MTDHLSSRDSVTTPLAVLQIRGGRHLRRASVCEIRIRTGRGECTQFVPSADLSLPLVAGSARAVCITETLEHLDIAAVLDLLLESHRVLAEGGALLLELPDFEAALERWARGDQGFFRQAPWALRDEKTWGAREAGDDLDTRAAALFCTYRRAGERRPPGPPRVDREALYRMRAELTPMGLSIALCNLAVDADERCRFDRQNAWSRRELAAMLRSVGFEVRSFEAAAVEATAADLPGVSIPRQQRMLCLAELAPRASTGAAAERFRQGLRLAKRGRLSEGLLALQEAVAQEPALAEAHYRLLWDLHTRHLRERAPHRAAPSPTFAQAGYHLGQLSADDAERMRRALAGAPLVRVTAADHAPGYMANPELTAEAEEAVNRDNQYLALGAEALARARPLLATLAAPVRACLGTPWRVVNLRAWKTPSHAARVEANGWHRDGPYPPMVVKIMIYLSEAGRETGTTEIVQADGAQFMASGPPGTFLVFKNSALIHRGAPPARGERLILEVTAAPHPEDDLRPVCAGQNADFPFAPWAHLEPA